MKKPEYYFFLNPYDTEKFTRCPQCSKKTKLRKYCLMIHYKDESKDFHQITSLNKTCKFCPDCDLIIGQKSDIEELLKPVIAHFGMKYNSENYMVFGTMARKDWKRCQEEQCHPSEVLKLSAPFKDVLHFDIIPAGWYFNGE